MLSADDRRLVARDPAIPGLATVLDDQALAARAVPLLQQRRVEACTITYVRYKPATSCLVGFQLCVDGATMRGHAKAHRHDDQDKAHKLPTAMPPGLGAATGDARGAVERVAIDDDLVTIVLLPLDRALPTVRHLADDEQRHDTLRRALPDPLAATVQELVPLSYKPNRRLVVRVDSRDGPIAVLRCLDETDYPNAVTAAATPWTVATPDLLGHDASRRLIATSWLPADHSMADVPTDAHARWALLGHTVACLHQTRSGHLPHTTPRQRGKQVMQTVDAVRAVHPGIADHVHALARALATDIAALPHRPVALHGDLSPDQVLVAGDQLSIIDFDAARQGDPADDLGSIAADMIATAIRRGARRDAVDDPFAALLAAYGTDVGNHVGLFVAANLLTRATEPFRHRWEGWTDATERLVLAARAWTTT